MLVYRIYNRETGEFEPYTPEPLPIKPKERTPEEEKKMIEGLLWSAEMADRLTPEEKADVGRWKARLKELNAILAK